MLSMKNILFVFAMFAAFACNNKSSSSDVPAATDTTNMANNPGTTDPTSNVADTMKMRDSIGVKDTSITDQTTTKKTGKVQKKKATY